MNEDEVRQDAIRYVEHEADTEVLKIEFAEKFTHWGQEQFVYIVQTTDEIGEWWVVAGETGTNLYPKEQFPNPDYLFSFHTGIMNRIIEKQVRSSPGTVGDKQFDVFICHASEDKDEFVDH